MVHWIGTPSPAALPPTPRVTARAGPGTVARVVSTRSGRRAPAAPADGLPWIWCCAGAPSAAAPREAACRGAYAVISPREAAGRERLPRRVQELSAIRAVPADEAGFVGHSPAARRLLREIDQAARTSQPVLLT